MLSSTLTMLEQAIFMVSLSGILVNCGCKLAIFDQVRFSPGRTERVGSTYVRRLLVSPSAVGTVFDLGVNAHARSPGVCGSVDGVGDSHMQREHVVLRPDRLGRALCAWGSPRRSRRLRRLNHMSVPRGRDSQGAVVAMVALTPVWVRAAVGDGSSRHSLCARASQ